MKPQVSAQLHSSSSRSSKIIRDHTQIETVVEVEGVGRVVLDVDSRGGYSLRAYPEGSEDPSRDLLAVGVVTADGIISIHRRGSLLLMMSKEPHPRSEVPMCEATIVPSPLFTLVTLLWSSGVVPG